ncbi:hypothetical protein CN558_04610 [Bacillus wiedmannii]|uniref:hypothetical protein n=1 Tax=Bacillus wiedmannii TaxID=1890302 RepID=UPI000BEF5BCC|nr:hypothetical protein [Bacillus wiedmannii]PEM89650.1 hypothetical protein CN627_08055 [Bacillus wiedmannii]PEO88259.1 hypothetical protein CN558_04610 [Bacillus wiedmannii]
MASLIEIIIDADDRASAQFRHTSTEAKKMAAIIGGVTIAASAMTPALLGGLGAVASLFGTAGIAAVGFGGLAATTIMKTWEKADDLEDAMLDVNAAMINNDAKGYAKAMAKVEAIWQDMTEAEKQAVVAINEFKDEWKAMEDQMTPTTLRVMAEGMDFLRLTMRPLFPVFQATGESFANMFAYMNQAIEQGRVNPFFEHMNTFAVPMFERVMISAGNILKGFGGLMVAFAPLGLAFGDGMVDMTNKFATWAWNLQSNPAFQNFVKMVQESTPVIFSLIGTIVDVLWTMIETLYPFAIRILAATDAFLKMSMESGALEVILKILGGALLLVAENMDWLIPLAGGLYLRMKALQIVEAVAKGLNAVFNAGTAVARGFNLLFTATGRQTIAQTALNATTWLFPGVWIAAAIMGVVAAGVLMWKNWDTISAYGKKLWGDIKKYWGKGSQWVEKQYENMKQSAISWWNDTSRDWNNTVNTVRTKSAEMYNAAVSKYESMKSDAKAYLSGMVNDAKTEFNSMVNSAWSGASAMWEAGIANAKSFATGFKNNMGDLGSVMWNGIKSVWDGANSWGKSFYNSGKHLLSNFADGIWTGVQMAYDNLWEGMKYIRRLLPFSPAKEGPLSDLDKSGKAFFPTWYNAAMTQVGSMQKAIGSAFSGVANEADVALAGTGLEAFTGGSNSMNVVITHKHEGSVKLDGSDLNELEMQVNQAVVGTGGTTGFGFDKQVIRRN